MNSNIDRILTLELVRVTERAAVASSLLVGRGNEKEADQAAVDAMRKELNKLDIQGEVVIGEGERDEAPMLYIGEKVGTGKGPKVDIALDPLEGTTLTAKGQSDALTTIAMAEKGSLLNAADVYMDKIAIGPGCPDDLVHLDEDPDVNIKAYSKATKKPIELYFAATPNGWKVSIMLEECKIPYKIIPVNIGKGDQFKPSFLKISPNNRIPAIIDPNGPGGKPISVFESGAILQYLGRKSGKFYPKNERERSNVDQWLFWQMGGLGPMAGQAHHFRMYAPQFTKEKLTYSKKRYTNEVNRLYGVMNKQLRKNDYLAGRYSIADMACWGWILPSKISTKMQGQKLKDFPHLFKWFEKVGARPAVQKGLDVGKVMRMLAKASRSGLSEKTKEAKKARSLLFNQKAR